MSVDIFPGETFEMEVVAVGQLQGSVPSIVQAHVIGQTQGTLDHSQIVRTVERTCTRLTLTVRTSNNKMDIGITTPAIALWQQTPLLSIIILCYTSSWL